MNIVFHFINERIICASREGNPNLSGFGNTEAEAVAQLLEREESERLEVLVLVNLCNSLFVDLRGETILN